MTADPIASATLARLYIEQGHLGRAKSVLDAVLERDPYSGHALALVDRLRTHSTAVVECRVEGTELVVKWRRVSAARLATVRLMVFGGSAGTRGERFDIPCRKPNGSHRSKLPDSPGSAVACILGPGDGDTRLPLAVAETLAW